MRVVPDDFDWTAYDELPERSKVIRPGSLVDAVIASFHGSGEASGAALPWEKARDKFRLRPGEVTVWAGVNGHRKSMLTTQIALGLMRQREQVLIASFEMRPRDTMKRMTRQAAMVADPSDAYVTAFHRWADADRLWLYDHYGTCDAKRALAVANYAARDLGVRHILVDSLMKVIRQADDYNGQKSFVGDLCALALAHGVHVHLVAHLRKGERETDAPDKFDIKGASEIADQVDNVVLVQKNLRKARAIERGDPDDGSPDQFVAVAKQRHGAYEGTLGLWFDDPSVSFAETPNRRAPFLPLELDPEAADERAAIQAEGA